MRDESFLNLAMGQQSVLSPLSIGKIEFLAGERVVSGSTGICSSGYGGSRAPPHPEQTARSSERRLNIPSKNPSRNQLPHSLRVLMAKQLQTLLPFSRRTGPVFANPAQGIEIEGPGEGQGSSSYHTSRETATLWTDSGEVHLKGKKGRKEGN